MELPFATIISILGLGLKIDSKSKGIDEAKGSDI